MLLRRSLFTFVSLWVSVAAFPQSLSQTDLVVGQLARVEVTGAAAGDDVAFLLSYVGIGSGPCFPSLGLCLDLVAPGLIAILPANASGSAAIEGIVPPGAPLIPVYTQGAVLRSDGTVTKTNAIAAAFLPISHLDDDFEDGVLGSEWSVLHPELFQWSEANGGLEIQPTVAGAAATWFQDQEGPYIYRTITGDFSVRATMSAEDPNAPGQAPPVSYRLGGLLLRSPLSTPGQRDSLHVALGAGTPSVPISAEDKTTDDSISDFLLYPIAAPHGQLRLDRQGSTVSLFFRDGPTSGWQLLRSHVRPDLPTTVFIGMMAYSNQSPAAIRVRFEEISFSP